MKNELKVNSSSFFDIIFSMVKIYTTSSCAYCHALMDWLEKKGVEYEEVDATKYPDISTVPVTEINGERIVGFDRPAIKRALREI